MGEVMTEFRNLEELSNRQDTQEETLRAIVSKNNSALYQF